MVFIKSGQFDWPAIDSGYLLPEPLITEESSFRIQCPLRHCVTGSNKNTKNILKLLPLTSQYAFMGPLLYRPFYCSGFTRSNEQFFTKITTFYSNMQ